MKIFSFFNRRSLSSKLFGGTLIALTAYVFIIGLLAFISTERSISNSYDDSLVVNANAVLYLMQQEASAGSLDKPLSLDISDENLTGTDKRIFDAISEYRMFRVWYNDRLVVSTQDSLTEAIPPFSQGFTDREISGNLWRIYALHAPQKNFIIELGEQQNARKDLVRSIAKDLILPFCISLPIVALMLWRAIRTGMSDLRKVTRQVNTRSQERMTPLDTLSVPADILPLVEAINDLLTRLDRSLSRERQITELAAHELRTPLTAIKLQAQLGLKANTDDGRIRALEGLVMGVERAGHLVEQLLTLTRVEQTNFELSYLDAGEICIRVASELRPLIERQNQTLEIDISEPLIAYANEDLLHLTINNLIGNAIKYSPEGSTITVDGKILKSSIEIRIIDQGPGIPENVKDKIFERFFRYDTGKILGSGLGLTIARQCAEHLHAKLDLSVSPYGKGLCAQLLLQRSLIKQTVS